MGYGSRLPNSNDPPKKNGTNPWIEETDIADAFTLLLNGMAFRCEQCKRPIRTKYLDDNDICPDCRG